MEYAIQCYMYSLHEFRMNQWNYYKSKIGDEFFLLGNSHLLLTRWLVMLQCSTISLALASWMRWFLEATMQWFFNHLECHKKCLFQIVIQSLKILVTTIFTAMTYVFDIYIYIRIYNMVQCWVAPHPPPMVPPLWCGWGWWCWWWKC